MAESRRLLLLVALTVLAATVATPAAAQQVVQVFASKLTSFVLVLLVLSFLFQVAFVHLGARFLRLEGGLLFAFLAVLLGGVLGAVAGVATIFSASGMPAAMQGIMISAATMAGGALAIKLLFSAPFPKALLLYLVALTLNTAAICVAMVLLY